MPRAFHFVAFNHAFAERASRVGTSIVDGEDPGAEMEQGNTLALDLDTLRGGDGKLGLPGYLNELGHSSLFIETEIYFAGYFAAILFLKAIDKVVAQVSQPAVSQCFQPADAANANGHSDLGALPIGNRRYSRLGNLRYVFAARRSGALNDFVNGLDKNCGSAKFCILRTPVCWHSRQTSAFMHTSSIHPPGWIVSVWILGNLLHWDFAAEGAEFYRALSKEYRIEVQKTEDGLPQNTVQCVLRDGNGYLWIGTRGSGSL